MWVRLVIWGVVVVVSGVELVRRVGRSRRVSRFVTGFVGGRGGLLTLRVVLKAPRGIIGFGMTAARLLPRVVWVIIPLLSWFFEVLVVRVDWM